MKQLISILVFVFSVPTWGASRFTLLSGYGSSATTNSETAVEGPLMLQLKLDTNLSHRMVLGIEHSRTIGIESNSSTIAVTTIGTRYHFLNPVENGLTKHNGEDFFSVKNYGWTPYVGLGLGFGSSSASEGPETEANATSLMLQAKFGNLWFFSDHFGFDTDFSYSLPVAGDGEVYLLTFGFGIFYNF